MTSRRREGAAVSMPGVRALSLRNAPTLSTGPSCCTVQCCTAVQRSAVQFSSLQCSAVQCSAVRCGAVWCEVKLRGVSGPLRCPPSHQSGFWVNCSYFPLAVAGVRGDCWHSVGLLYQSQLIRTHLWINVLSHEYAHKERTITLQSM